MKDYLSPLRAIGRAVLRVPGVWTVARAMAGQVAGPVAVDVGADVGKAILAHFGGSTRKVRSALVASFESTVQAFEVALLGPSFWKSADEKADARSFEENRSWASAP